VNKLKHSIKCVLIACVVLTGVFPITLGLQITSDNEKIQQLLTSTDTNVQVWMMLGRIDDLQKNNDSTSFYPVSVFVLIYQNTPYMTGWYAGHMKSTTQRFYAPSEFDFKGILTRHFICGIFRQTYVLPPEIVFTMDIFERTLTVISVDSNEILWADIINTQGTCTIPTTGYVTSGDVITGCYGTITLQYTPTDTILGTFQFPIEIIFDLDITQRKLVVESVSPNDILWADMINIGNGSCVIPSYVYVMVGDAITDCYGRITLLHIPSGTRIGTFQFPS
jgi:hypothetical protein